MDGKTKIST